MFYLHSILNIKSNVSLFFVSLTITEVTYYREVGCHEQDAVPDTEDQLGCSAEFIKSYKSGGRQCTDW